VPADLVSWLQLVFKRQGLVLDVEFVRACLAKPVLAVQLERLATVKDRDGLERVVSDLLGPVVVEAIKKEPQAYSDGIVQLCGALARTIQAAKTPPPPPAAPKPEAKEKPAP
jgi:hypothetical protein